MAIEETRAVGPWEQMKNSFGGMLIGLLLLPGAFFIVYISTCREQASVEMKGALPASEAAKAAADNKPVYATGKLDSSPVGDPQFVKPGKYLKLSRSAQIMAWVHKETTKTEGSGTTKKETKTYDCKLEWTSSPDLNVGSKKGCEGKTNFSATYSSADFAADSVTINSSGTTYSLNPSAIDPVKLPGAKVQKSDLTRDMTEYSGAFYPEAACATSSPKAGCEKITFSGTSYEAGKDYTAVGKLVGNQFEEYSTGKSGILAGHWLKLGPGSFKETMSAVSSADSGWTIGLYLGSVFCFWLGLVLLTGPILQLIEFIPIIGGFGEGLIKVIFGVFSFVIMGLAFLIIKYFLFILLGLALIAGFLIYKKKSAPAA